MSDIIPYLALGFILGTIIVRELLRPMIYAILGWIEEQWVP